MVTVGYEWLLLVTSGYSRLRVVTVGYCRLRVGTVGYIKGGYSRLREVYGRLRWLEYVMCGYGKL